MQYFKEDTDNVYCIALYRTYVRTYMYRTLTYSMYTYAYACTYMHDVVTAHATSAELVSEVRILSNSHSNGKRRLIVTRFDHEGLHQLQNCFCS